MRVNCKNNGNYTDCCLQIKAKCFLDKVFTPIIFLSVNLKKILNHIFLFLSLEFYMLIGIRYYI